MPFIRLSPYRYHNFASHLHFPSCTTLLKCNAINQPANLSPVPNHLKMNPLGNKGPEKIRFFPVTGAPNNPKKARCLSLLSFSLLPQALWAGTPSPGRAGSARGLLPWELRARGMLGPCSTAPLLSAHAPGQPPPQSLSLLTRRTKTSSAANGTPLWRAAAWSDCESESFKDNELKHLRPSQ